MNGSPVDLTAEMALDHISITIFMFSDRTEMACHQMVCYISDQR